MENKNTGEPASATSQELKAVSEGGQTMTFCEAFSHELPKEGRRMRATPGTGREGRSE